MRITQTRLATPSPPSGVSRPIGPRFTSELGTRLRRFLAAYPKDQHGVQRYSLAQFGLRSDEVALRFHAYISRFNPAPEVA